MILGAQLASETQCPVAKSSIHARKVHWTLAMCWLLGWFLYTDYFIWPIAIQNNEENEAQIMWITYQSHEGVVFSTPSPGFPSWLHCPGQICHLHVYGNLYIPTKIMSPKIFTTPLPFVLTKSPIFLRSLIACLDVFRDNISLLLERCLKLRTWAFAQ